MKTESAQASAIIRKFIKSLGVKASVRSDNFAGGSSIDVVIKDDVPEETVKAIQEFCEPYKYDKGGRIDDSRIYEFRDDIPQAGFIFVRKDWKLNQ
mgnify:CR=1 FL=1